MVTPGGVAGGAGASWRELLAELEVRLADPGDARRIVERASGYPAAELWVHLDELVPARAVGFVDAMAARRATGEPLQYVVGLWGFRTLELLVDRRVLIPRPETEVVVEVALAELDRVRAGDGPEGAREAGPVQVADLGTGSGAIALSVAAERPGTRVWATDRSPEALAVARANLAGTGSRVAPLVALAEGHWFHALPADLRGTLDLVVANPPYVPDGDLLPAEVEGWEPRIALRSGPQGLDALAEIIGGAPAWLRRPGTLVLEIDPRQAAAVAAMTRAAGWSAVEVHADLAGRDRVLVARWEA